MSFWCKDEPVLDASGRVTRGGMFDHQREWWMLNTFIRMLVAGFGAGKTELLCKWIIATALHNAPSWSSIVSPTFPQARKTVIPTLERLLTGKATLRPDMKWNHNKGDHTFTIQLQCMPAATVIVQSGENPDSLKGPNLGTVGIDEPFIQHSKVFDMMVSRCRDPQARLHAIGLGGTPEELNWGYELAEGELREKYEVGVVTADTFANKALPKAYRERLVKGYDPKAVEAYVQGKFVSLSTGRVYYAFDRWRNVREVAPEGGTPFWGTDFNVNPMAFVIGWHRGDRVHITHEYELPNSDTESAAALVKEKHPDVRVCFPDPTGKRRQTNAPAGMSDFKWIQKAGFVVLAPIEPWGRRDSLNSVNKKLSDGSLTIDPSCKKLVRYLSEHTFERMNQQENMTHLLDALRYPITYVYPAYRPTTATTKVVGL